MTVKWLLAACVGVWFTVTVQSEPITHVAPDPVSVLITCMSVLHVMGDHASAVDGVLWRITAAHIHAWLRMHVPEPQHAQMHEAQHVLETHMMYQLIDMPHMMRVAQMQARNCHDSLVGMFSILT
jgi:hypothetical protein